MNRIITAIIVSVLITSCINSQNTKNDPTLVGGPCEGCEAIFEFGDRKLRATDTLPDFHKQGPKIKVEGTVYQADGKTKAKDIIIYIHHTNKDGFYAPTADAKGWERRHGYNRSWLKTDINGHYEFYTIKPAPYPNRTEPAHIHYTIKEPNGKYYWIDSAYFEGDSLLTKKELNPVSPRGGSPSILRLKEKGDLLVGTRDLILGMNISGYDD